MELALAALPGVITSCLLVWVLSTVLAKQNEERQSHRIEVDALNTAHAEQLSNLIADNRREVQFLCQRIQDPPTAVAQHASQNVTDPPSVDLENGATLAKIQQRENDLQMLENTLHERAEQLAAEA